jgi:hypothetical protein
MTGGVILTEIGKIEKPEAARFSEKKKLYCVPNVYPLKDSSEEYQKLFNAYWSEVAQQLEKLEAIGGIKKIFYENIYVQGEEALEVISKMNESVLQIIKAKVEKGAVLLPIETEEIFGAYLDWSNCVRIVRTKPVFDTIFALYTETFNKRIKHILNVIESNLSEKEAGLLIIKDEDRTRLQFPQDIEVFLVTPPSYDSILKWIRDKWREMYRTEESKEEEDSVQEKNP